MPDNLRIRDLVEEVLESKRTPEEVCSDTPHLLPAVRKRLEQFQRIGHEVDALFPDEAPTYRENASILKTPLELPTISGYEVTEIIGRGGMGVVFKARHLKLNRIVALKMLLAGPYACPEELARFHREAEAVAALRHLNIVPVHDAGECAGRPYFTMEYVEGGTLEQSLAARPLPPRRAAELVATLAAAVQFAHQNGFIHRDLKPGNILLTADGTPKITDFGLARAIDAGPEFTQSGARIGTPSYMAPEQALGHTSAMGTAVDIYALGALLYELLTGRPPFLAGTVAETERQVIAEEPVPPTRLNAQVPRDLETICLKCLHKEPQRRYATAAALVDDLQRYLRGEPIAARPTGFAERTYKWVRRHPTGTALLAASLLVVTMLVVGSQWVALQQMRQRDAVGADLKELAVLQKSARWADAQAALKRAEAQLEDGRSDDLRRQLDQARRDLKLIMQLDAIRLKRVTCGELPFYKTQAHQHYTEAFRRAGLGQMSDPSAPVAAIISDSAVRGPLLEALYDWVTCAPDREQRRWLLDVASQADPSPDRWRQRLFDPAVWDDPRLLGELARTAPEGKQSMSLTLALSERLIALKSDGQSLLKRVHKEHPTDFWANLILGNALLQGAPVEAHGCYMAALANRPGEAVGYCAVGDALRLQHKLDEAAHFYQQALQRDPGYARAHSNLGLVAQSQDRLDEAIDWYGKALQRDPDYGWAHSNLGRALQEKGRLEEACRHFREMMRVDPTNVEGRNSLINVLLRMQQGQEALRHTQAVIAANPAAHESWSGYAELALFLGDHEEYGRARRALLDRFGATTNPYIAEPVARACLLLPGSEAELQQAATLADRAVAAEVTTPAWIYRYFLFAKGLAEYRRGRLSSAVSLMKGEAAKAMGPAPLLVLAMAQHDLGQTKQSRQTLATAISTFDWSATEADRRDVWIVHILRREAETKILTNLPAFLRGEYQPQRNDERLALLGICQFQARGHAAAQLYADAFGTDPGLSETLTAACQALCERSNPRSIGRLDEMAAAGRYPAARCAALAGCRRGADAAQLTETEAMRWRKQARDWLRADLGLWSKLLDRGTPVSRMIAKKMLRRWQVDPDLAGLRDAPMLETFSTDERTECLTLWNDVRAALERTQETR
jgi:serine/threonine-protein kinase